MDMTILTDVGQRRTNNQDYANQYTNKAGKPMVFLADGMGGHRAGNIASEMAVTDLGAAWVSSEIETVNQVREWFAEHLEAVNRRIHLAGQDDEHKGMGTTLEAFAFCRRTSDLCPRWGFTDWPHSSGRIPAVDQ